MSPRSRPMRCWRASVPTAVASTTSRAGLDAGPPVLVTPPPDLVEQMELDPPAARVDPVAFAAKGLAGRLLSRLAERGLACTRVVIEAETEHGERLARCWRHDRVLTPAALAERVRWQLDGWLAAAAGNLDDAISTTPPAGSRSCGSFPTRSCPPTAASWDSGVATRPRTTAPTGRSRACRACSATKRSRPRSCKVGAPPRSRCGGCRGATRASRSGRWWSTRSRPRGRVRCRRRSRARVSTRPRPRSCHDEHGHAVVVSGRGEQSAAPARVECALLPGGGGAVRGLGRSVGLRRAVVGPARAPAVRTLAGRRRLRRRRGRRRVRRHGGSRPGRHRSDLRLIGCTHIYG